jgi:ferredoxin
MKTIKIHGDDWDIPYILDMLEDIKGDEMVAAKWVPRDALVRLDGSRATIYTGQEFNPDQYRIERNFWDHDHCQVCNWTLCASSDPEHFDGYTDGYFWMCAECYQRFVVKKELNDEKRNHHQQHQSG